MSSKLTIIEGNSNDKDDVRAYFLKGEKGDKGDKGEDGTGTKLSDLENDMGFVTDTEIEDLINEKVLALYPIGSLYFTVNNVNPGLFIGGYWEQVAEGQFLVGVGTGTDMNDVEKTFVAGENAGEYEHSHAPGDMYAMANPVSAGINYVNKHKVINTDFQISGLNGSKSETASYNENAGIDIDGDTETSSNIAPSFGLYAWVRKTPPINP